MEADPTKRYWTRAFDAAVATVVRPRWTIIPSCYFLVSVIVTWPLLRHPGSRLVGDLLDPWQTVWGFWWWHESLSAIRSPFACQLLWWPDGISLWFQTFDIPAATGALLLAHWLPTTALYNIAVFLSFPLAGFTFYLFSRELWGGQLAPFLAGCLYTFSTFHFGHAQGTLHMSSMQWSPLFFFFIARLDRAQHWVRTAVLAGVAISLATLSSIYHLVLCIVAIVIRAIWNLSVRCLARQDKSSELNIRLAPRLTVVVAVFLALSGWLLLGMLVAYRSERYWGGHNALMFSADLQSVMLPNAVNRSAAYFPEWRSWALAAPVVESGAYVGYVAWVLALGASFFQAKARPYFAIAVVGTVLSLGPFLQIGGNGPHVLNMRVAGTALPFKLVEQYVPGISFSGMPVRFSWLATFGVSVAAGALLANICRAGSRGKIAALMMTALGLVEVWPSPFITTAWPRPAFLVNWSEKDQGCAVLDATASSRALWHQTLHRHPIIAGYTSRWPERLALQLQQDDALRPFFRPPWGTPGAIREPLSVSPAVARQRLRQLRICLVIVDDTRTDIPETMELHESYRGDGLVIYHIPDVAARASLR
jgi:hypothetical protein